jgi:hypothetical protein
LFGWVQNFPKLFETCSRIHCYQLAVSGLKEELLLNFKRSCRGSLRQPPNVITWVLGLRNLASRGLKDSAAVITAWNNQCGSKHDALVGAKFAATKLLMEKMPEPCFQLLQGCVSTRGWTGCAFSEDALNNKRLFPGHVFRSPKEGWKSKLTVTADSMQLMLARTIHDHEMLPPAARRKVTKKSLEECACLSKPFPVQCLFPRCPCPARGPLSPRLAGHIAVISA